MVQRLSTLVAQEVVVMITSGANNDDKIGMIATFRF